MTHPIGFQFLLVFVFLFLLTQMAKKNLKIWENAIFLVTKQIVFITFVIKPIAYADSYIIYQIARSQTYAKAQHG